MFDQLTWSLGMFTQSACVLFVVGYCLRNTVLAETWNVAKRNAPSENWIFQIALPAVGLTLVYVLELGFLYWTDNNQDSTALDWAVVVLLLGGLVVRPLAAIIATVFTSVARASLVFSYSADTATKATFESHGRWLLDIRFWLDELWVWGNPGVILLLTCAFLGIGFQAKYRIFQKCEYPLWIGIPIALIAQAAFLLAADLQWGRDSAITYLRNEALSAAVSIAIVTTALILLLRVLVSAKDRSRRQDAELASTRHQLNFLNAQINPHFLNNSLNAVAAVSRTHPERTRELIDKLALHYRAQCDTTSSLVRFEDEMRVVRCYIDIEQVRMGDRLKVQEQIDAACYDVPLPRLVIQPLVENAIQHGIQGQRENGVLKINASLHENCLIVTVEDNGPGRMKNLTQSEFGIGLTNVSSRLNHFYDRSASLVIKSKWGDGTKVTLNIPAMIEEPA